jgi:hypothetical protein
VPESANFCVQIALKRNIHEYIISKKFPGVTPRTPIRNGRGQGRDSGKGKGKDGNYEVEGKGRGTCNFKRFPGVISSTPVIKWKGGRGGDRNEGREERGAKGVEGILGSNSAGIRRVLAEGCG